MSTKEFFSFVTDQLDNPLFLLFAVVLFLLPKLASGLKFSFQFYDDYRVGRHKLRTSNLKLGLEAVEDEADKRLLAECYTQEIFRGALGMSMSARDRKAVLEWLSYDGITIEMIRRAWPHVWAGKGEELKPRFGTTEKVTLGYSLFLGFGFAVLALGSFILAVESYSPVRSPALILAAVICAGALFYFSKEADQLLSARNLKHFLSQTDPATAEESASVN